MLSHLLGIIRMEQEGVEKAGVEGLMSGVQGAVFRQVTSRTIHRSGPGKRLARCAAPGARA